jgi:hypothetical protein
MSWQLNITGEAEALKRALRAYSNSLHGWDRTRFNKARPVLEQLVDLNANGDGEMILSATCSGGDGENGGMVSIILMPSTTLHVR